jgi:hypothetical protein
LRTNTSLKSLIGRAATSVPSKVARCGSALPDAQQGHGSPIHAAATLSS